MVCGVHPPSRCAERIGRGWLMRKISFARTENICPVTSFAASLHKITAIGAICFGDINLRRVSMWAFCSGVLAGIASIMRLNALGAMQFERTW